MRSEDKGPRGLLVSSSTWNFRVPPAPHSGGRRGGPTLPSALRPSIIPLAHRRSVPHLRCAFPVCSSRFHGVGDGPHLLRLAVFKEDAFEEDERRDHCFGWREPQNGDLACRAEVTCPAAGATVPVTSAGGSGRGAPHCAPRGSL